MAADDSGVRTASRPSLASALSRARPLLLDGATGTELERRGVRAELPLWSSWGLLEAPEVVREIHADYLRAGAEALTAATFRTHARSLAAAGLEARAAELCALAVRLAREAGERTEREAFVLGSAAPLEDCYHPERVPPDDALQREHARHARHLVRAGADAILVETINTVREGVAAACAAREAGAELLVSFVCARAARLLSGEPLGEALDAVAPFAPLAVGVNCLPPDAADECLPVLRAPFLVYANLGAPGAPLGAAARDATPAGFAAHARRWAEAGAAALGGCCGTGPAHIRALATALSRTPLPAAQ
jgi:S-methylmethionine-dependent homocysteine/selenocysteine methylase